MPRPKKTPQKTPPLTIRGFALSDPDVATLARLAADLSDLSGRKQSASSALRALLAWARQQSSHWTKGALLPAIEQEIEAGRLWGGERSAKQ